MEVEVRKSVCKTCPFRKESEWQITRETVNQMLKDGTISPCHQELEKYSGSRTSGVELYAEKTPIFKVCRGYVEATIHLPKPQALWTKLNLEFIRSHHFTKDVILYNQLKATI
tara:strand:+ start:266 stop:604 length:339 start_codon:yes stop_codon:yes gene_type:complete